MLEKWQADKDVGGEWTSYRDICLCPGEKDPIYLKGAASDRSQERGEIDVEV